MEIVSGRTGKAHVTSQQFRQIIEGIVGDGSCILPSGENLEPELVSNNSLKIRSGIMCHHGNISSVKIGTYDEIELTNCTQVMKMIDLVVNRYTRNEEDNTEKNEWIVIMGTPAESNPTVPEYTKGNLQEGDLVDDCPAFEVHFDGINITEVTKVLEIAQTNKDLSNKIANIPQIKAGTIIKTVVGGNNSSDVFTNAEINKMFGVSDATNLNTVAIFTEGDAAARTSGGHMEGTAYLNGTWYATYAELFSGTAKVRINYTIIYFG